MKSNGTHDASIEIVTDLPEDHVRQYYEMRWNVLLMELHLIADILDRPRVMTCSQVERMLEQYNSKLDTR